MDSGRWTSIFIWTVGGLFAAMAGCLIVDDSGPYQRTDGTILSTQYEEGITTTTHIKAGEVEVPIQNQIPGAWIVEIDTPVLGKIKVSLDDDKRHPGQRVSVRYHVGKLTGTQQVVDVRPQSELLTEH